MSKEGIGRVVAVGKAKTRYITVPSDVASDDRFPFTNGEEVRVTIQPDKKSLTVMKVE
jgi:co-chaperonin GroES (HSP10)